MIRLQAKVYCYECEVSAEIEIVVEEVERILDRQILVVESIRLPGDWTQDVPWQRHGEERTAHHCPKHNGRE